LKKIIKTRLLALLLAFAMAFGLMPIPTFAQDIEADVLLELEVDINRDVLIATIAEAQGKNQYGYIPDSWADLQLAILLAIIVLDNKDATQAEVDEAVTALRSAVDVLDMTMARTIDDGRSPTTGVARMVPQGIVPALNGETITIFISLEGYNLGHGFYIEPLAVEIPSNLTLADATMYFLQGQGKAANATVNDASGEWDFIVHGLGRGYANLPLYILDEIDGSFAESNLRLHFLDLDAEHIGFAGLFGNEAPIGATGFIRNLITADKWYNEDCCWHFPLRFWMGWRATINHNVLLPEFGDICPTAKVLADGDVVRWQFSLVSGGCGIVNSLPALDLGWSGTPYTHEDKTELIRAASVNGLPIDIRQDALAIIINPLATSSQVSSMLAVVIAETPAQIIVDKDVLNAAITAAELLDEADYTVETWTAMQASLASAKSVRDNAGVTQTEVNNAANALDVAMGNLEPASAGVEWAGSGTTSDPYLISNANELMLLATRVNEAPNAAQKTGTHFRLTADIALGSDWPSIGQADIRSNWVNPNAHQGSSFDGIFDGGGHTIAFAHGSPPLFGAVQGNAQIRNLNIFGPYITGHGLIAGVSAQQAFWSVDYIPIDNVRILSGTTIRGSGFAGTDGFRPQQLAISNSTIEAGVRIGFDANTNAPFDQNLVYFANTAGSGPGVGSFVSGLAGRINNSVSYATVYGHPNVVNVGGLVGYKQQSMRTFEIENSHFHGTIIAPQSRFVGGILGAGYDSPNPRNRTPTGQLGSFFAAPNTPGGNIHNSTVTGSITGYDYVGGIVGGEFANQAWSTGSTRLGTQHVVQNNHFEGTLTATAANTRNIGAIFGYIRSLNRNNAITGNTFADNTGATRGIGHVSIVDTTNASPMAISGTTYFSSQGNIPGNVAGFGGISRMNYHRTDDPLGADSEVLAKMVGGTVIIVDKAALNMAISAAQGLTASSYTPNSWAAMQTALSAAIGTRDDANATQTQVDNVLYALNAAANRLVAYVPTVEKSALIAEIARAEGRAQANYTGASWSNMQAALTNARAVNSDINATQAQVNTATGNLITAINVLAVRANFTALNAEIARANGLVQSNYTIASWSALQVQLTAAISMSGNTNATQSEVDGLASTLSLVIGALVVVSVDRSALNSEIARAEGRTQVNYTAESWAAMQTALTNATATRDNANATQSQVDLAASGLRAATDALVAVSVVSRDALNSEITRAERHTQANYTSLSWAAMQTALATARTVRDNTNATQQQIDNVTNGLRAAIDNLVIMPPPTVGARVWLTVQNPNARSGDPTNFLPGRYIDIVSGETAYSILRRADVGLSIRSTGHHTWSGMYVEAINGWGEFDGGPLSGWMYAVNGVFPEFSASLFDLRDGDRLYWLYTYELGNDLARFGSGAATGSDRGVLRTAIARAEALMQANYTVASWATIQTALTAARQVYARTAATQAEINTAANNLNAAVDNRRRVSTANRTALEAEIARVEAMTETDYTAASWARMQTALTAAISVRDNTSATQNQIDAATNALRAAVDARARMGAVNLTVLNQEILQAGGRVQANYTPASWTAMQAALTAARNVRDNTNTMQTQIDTAAGNLRAALNGLVTVSGVNVVSLSNEITRAEARSQSNYTTASWSAMQTSLTAARQMRNNTNATQSQIDQATANLASAINALVREAGPSAPLGAAPAPEVAVVSVVREVDVTATNYGTVAATIANEAIRNLIVQAREERATNITINISATQAVTRIETELSVLSIREIAADGLSLTIQSGMARISLDDVTLAGLALGAADDGMIRIMIEAIGNSHYRLAAMVGDQYVNNFNGRVMVTIPYAPSIPAEDHDLLTIYRLDDDGNVREMIGAHYANSQMVFATNHFSVFFISEWINPFIDVSSHDWYFRNVRFAYSNGLMSGTGYGQFAPNINLSRGMVVTMLWRLEGMPATSSGNAFRDVQSGNWYADAIAWASANGIVNGYGNGLFGPNDNITREQFAVILQNHAQLRGENAFGGALATDFADADSISPWAQEAMEWANTNGLITGRTMSTLAPNGTATRAESAAILQRFIEAR